MDKIDNILDRLQNAQQPAIDTPDELTERIMASLPEREATTSQRQKGRIAWLYSAIAAAACVLLFIGVGVATQQEKVQTPELVNANIQDEIPISELAVADEREEIQPSKVVTPDVREEMPTSELAAADERETIPTPKSAAADKREYIHSSPKTIDENLHYAAYTETQDTAEYQAPARVVEYIEKLAAFHHIEGEVLSDSIARSIAYVFPDNDKVRLFDRLLQVACTYSYDSPGYQMTISQQQLFFTLEDRHLQRRYLWLAERIGGGRIILYATHAPTDAALSSERYQEFRERITHTNQTTEL